MRAVGDRARLIAWSGVLVVVLWFLHSLGAGALGTPPVTNPSALGDWLERVGLEAAVVAVIRILALAIGWWLLVVTLVGALARATRVDRAQQVADHVTPGFVRTLLGPAGAATAVGLTLGVAPLLAASLGHDRAPASVPPDEALWPSTDMGAAAIHRLEFAVAASISPSGGPATLERVSSPDEPPPGTWMVETGDHLWSIAETTLAGHEGRPVSDHEVERYWRRVIETNRAQLVDPDNADLIYPGQRVVLPPLDAAGDLSADQAAGA